MPLTDSKRLKVVYNRSGDVIYMLPRFAIAEPGERVSSRTERSHKEIRALLGDKGLALFEALSKLPISWYVVSKRQLEVAIPTAYSSDEIEPAVLSELKGIYGDFTVDREPRLVLLSHWIYRNILAPMGLIPK